MSKKGYTSSRVSLATLSVDEALSALLKTPPPLPGDRSTQKQKSPRTKKKAKRRSGASLTLAALSEVFKHVTGLLGVAASHE